MRISVIFLVCLAAVGSRARAGVDAFGPKQAADQSNETKSPKRAMPFIIEKNTQATLGNLRIAAFNPRRESYTDASGAERHGHRMALQVFVRGDASKSQKLRVHTGQEFTVDKRTFKVIHVTDKQVKLIVKNAR